jgi:hypothetical protein
MIVSASRSSMSPRKMKSPIPSEAYQSRKPEEGGRTHGAEVSH